jgi:hypothetical protein
MSLSPAPPRKQHIARSTPAGSPLSRAVVAADSFEAFVDQARGNMGMCRSCVVPPSSAMRLAKGRSRVGRAGFLWRFRWSVDWREDEANVPSVATMLSLLEWSMLWSTMLNVASRDNIEPWANDQWVSHAQSPSSEILRYMFPACNCGGFLMH